MISQHFPILQVLVPLTGAPLCVLIRNKTVCWWLALIISLCSLFVSASLLYTASGSRDVIYYLGGWIAPFGIEYRIDTLNAFVMMVVSGISSVTLVFARTQILHEINESRAFVFYAAWLLCLCGLLGMCATGDIFNIFVFLEISSLSMYLLIAIGRERQGLTAAFSYLILGTIGATFFLTGIALLYAATGTLNISDLAVKLPGSQHTGAVTTAFVFITLGIGIKAAVFPLHWWLPNAYRYAPTTATVFLAGTATKVSVYLLVRFYFELFGNSYSFAVIPLTEILLVAGVAATLVMSVVAIMQEDVKKLLAFSSIAQIGYMVIGMGLNSVTGLTATLIHVFNHALIKSALFMALGAAFVQTGGYRLEHIRGLGSYAPWTMAALLAGGLSLIGVPLTAGFVSKWYLVLAAFEQQRLGIAILVVASSVLAVVYVWKIVEAGYFRTTSIPPERQREPSAAVLIPLWFLIAANVYFGIDTRLPVNTAARAAQDLMGF